MSILREEIEQEIQTAKNSQPDIAAYLNGEKSLEEISNLQSAINIIAANNGVLRKSLLRLADEIDVVQKGLG